MEGGLPVTLTHRGGAWCPPPSCPSQWYSSLSLLWSVFALSWVLAWRVGVLWHSHIGGEPGVPRCLVQVNGTPVFHCHGPYWLIAGYWHGGWASCDTHTSGGSLVSPAVLSKSMVLQSFTVMVRIGFKLGIGMEGGRPVTLTHRGGAWCPPLSCPSQWYSNLSLLWSELAFSWVLAWRVGILWHSHAGGEAGVSPLSCSSQWYSSLSLSWSVLAYSWVLAWRVGVLWHSHIGGEPGVPRCLVQVNGTPVFHCYGPYWL